MAVNCRNCRFFIPDSFEQDDIEYELTYGQCRRYPPKRIDENVSGFPMVEEDWVCGEHQTCERFNNHLEEE